MTDRVQVTVPVNVWGRLASEADTRGVTVEDILVAAINHVIRPQGRREMILAFVRAGFTDAQVAAHTGELVGFVAQVRRDAGLKAVRGSRG
ncbi:MAG TPA: hypothetical protein EYQ64_03215 [Gemmatimonadetes bacterium]|nr:hypothetical protein [Gemmatimonadota bacterium]|tara:strand:+ start:176 stop:448 length:273 start_codon:yes stop_codon:yes gene_type:complete